MSFATSRQLPAQKPGRSFVVWIGRPAGEVMARTSGTCAVGDRRMLRQAEQRLRADFDRRARGRGIVDRVAGFRQGWRTRPGASRSSRRAAS